MYIKKRDLFHILLPTTIVTLLFLILFYGVFLPSFRESLLAEKKQTIREMTSSAWSLLGHYHTLEKKGVLSRDVAQRQALETIRTLRYGPDNKNYFWVNTMDYVLLMHPYRTDLEGKNVEGFADPSGKLLFNAFVDIVNKNGAGYVNYLWQWQDDPSRIVPKLSHVRGFAPWGWIIGTGMYLQDVNREIASLTRSAILFFLMSLPLVLLVSAYIVRQNLKATEKHRRAEAELRDHRDQLEEMVELRTRELSSANLLLEKEIRQRIRTQEQIARDHAFLSTVIESLPFPFYVIDAHDYRIVMANQIACETGEGRGEQCFALTHGRTAPCHGENHLCPLEAVKQTGEPVKTEHVHTDKKGVKRFVEVHGYPIFDEKGDIVQMIEFTLDITQQKSLEEELVRMSITDPLTGLCNRRGFMLMATEQLKLSKRMNKTVYLLFVDMDGMKHINDTFGHAAGDQALIETAGILKETLRESDIIGRLGGDEFAAMLVNGDTADTTSTIIGRLEEHLAAFNSGSQHPFSLSLSYGIVQVEKESLLDLDGLLMQADSLMYQEKTRKRNKSTQRTDTQ